MVSIYDEKNQRTAVKNGEAMDYVTLELRGVSTDEKPTNLDGKNIDNGSMFIEIDTGKIYMFNLSSNQWVEFSGSSNNSSSDNQEEDNGR